MMGFDNRSRDEGCFWRTLDELFTFDREREYRLMHRAASRVQVGEFDVRQGHGRLRIAVIRTRLLQNL